MISRIPEGDRKWKHDVAYLPAPTRYAARIPNGNRKDKIKAVYGARIALVENPQWGQKGVLGSQRDVVWRRQGMRKSPDGDRKYREWRKWFLDDVELGESPTGTESTGAAPETRPLSRPRLAVENPRWGQKGKGRRLRRG